MADKKITIYTTPTCAFCAQAKQWFKQNNIEYTELNVAEDAKARQEMISKTGQLAVPVIEIDGQVVIGWNEGKVKQLLEM